MQDGCLFAVYFGVRRTLLDVYGLALRTERSVRNSAPGVIRKFPAVMIIQVKPTNTKLLAFSKSGNTSCENTGPMPTSLAALPMLIQAVMKIKVPKLTLVISVFSPCLVRHWYKFVWIWAWIPIRFYIHYMKLQIICYSLMNLPYGLSPLVLGIFIWKILWKLWVARWLFVCCIFWRYKWTALAILPYKAPAPHNVLSPAKLLLYPAHGFSKIAGCGLPRRLALGDTNLCAGFWKGQSLYLSGYLSVKCTRLSGICAGCQLYFTG